VCVPRVAVTVWMQVVVSTLGTNAIDIACAVHGCRYLASSLTFLQRVCGSQLQAVLCKSQKDAAALGSG
jgi:hypothetical protein